MAEDEKRKPPVARTLKTVSDTGKIRILRRIRGKIVKNE